MNNDQIKLLLSLDELFDSHPVTRWLSVAKDIGLTVHEDGIRQFKALVKLAVRNILNDEEFISPIDETRRTSVKKLPKKKKKAKKKVSAKKRPASDVNRSTAFLKDSGPIDMNFARWLDIISPTRIEQQDLLSQNLLKRSSTPRLSQASRLAREIKKPRK